MKTMNSIQKNYIIAKATWEAVCEVQKEKYKEFLSLKGLVEKSYSLFRGTEEVEYNDELLAEYDEFAEAEIANTALAHESLQLAEKALIAFGLSIAPKKYREALANGIKRYVNKKKEFIDITLKLDVRTLPKYLQEVTA